MGVVEETSESGGGEPRQTSPGYCGPTLFKQKKQKSRAGGNTVSS